MCYTMNIQHLTNSNSSTHEKQIGDSESYDNT